MKTALAFLSLTAAGCAHRALKPHPLRAQDRAAIERTVREMQDATRGIVFQSKP